MPTGPLKKSLTLELEESVQTDPYFMQSPDNEVEGEKVTPPAPKELIPISVYGDNVIIIRDVVSSTIALTSQSLLPSGLVVGAPLASTVHVGDRVRFNDTMIASKDCEHPAYPGVKLTVISSKYIFYKLP